ncbi:hypothetical protein FACS1894109_01280 [Spirochaetia bacterium]|nr:hypothetical protein FACS1894109_01280 [Spirochaetia bacterium]
MNSTGLIEVSRKGMALFSRPFLFMSNQRPKILKALEDDVIQERDGVHFISDSVFEFGKDMEKNLNSEFKNLVDSVLMQK